VAAGLSDPDAMTLSTVAPDGQPSSRQVLLKGLDERGLVFYTNLESRKGRELEGNARVSLLFFWRELDTQVEVQGAAEPVSDAEADAYFASRPRGSQLGAWASAQSRELSGRARLLADVARTEARFLGRAVDRPPWWAGFRVVPRRFEFWHRGLFRLHDRVAYEKEGDGWRSKRLYP
jgi:pyridoxamine 5'-phosphate oxidase